MSAEEFEKLLHETFPADPVPSDLFSKPSYADDFTDDIRKCCFGRRWVDVSIHDWSMTGMHLSTIISCMSPEAFIYYLPSILLGSIKDASYLDWGIEAVLPANQKHIPRGSWWYEFFGGTTSAQKKAICAFLRLAIALAQPSSAELSLAGHGLEAIWGDPSMRNTPHFRPEL